MAQKGRRGTLPPFAPWRSVSSELAPLFTIEPGVDRLFAPDVGVSVTGTGYLVAEGNSKDHITMGATTGPWQGVAITNSGGSLDYLDITAAGSIGWNQVDAAGAITIIARRASASTR
ncbi:MAG: hypothetical protein PVJ80_14325 [Gemmatimonadota bacterium]|jgi:hypothetical protein